MNIDLLDINFWRTATTVASFVIFIGLLAWAYAPKNKARFDEAAQLPFQEDQA
jgi:cytochrome c oxidase cbb3-type subunit IV